MTFRRHSEEARIVFGVTPAQLRLPVEVLRRRASRRKMLLLECSIIRLAPFGECGRSIWELLPTFNWFETKLPDATYTRAERAHRQLSPDEGLRTPRPEIGVLHRCNGHQAVELFEAVADDDTLTDGLLLAEEYCRSAEYSAEADRFGYDPDRLPGSELRYGVADWLLGLYQVGPELWNTLDYYLATYPGQYYRWAGYRPLHSDHRQVALHLIADILGHPLRQPRFDPSWRIDSALCLAAAMYDSRDFSPMPILADALEEAGCDHPDVLSHCRGPGPHVRGCWVVDLVLGKG